MTSYYVVLTTQPLRRQPGRGPYRTPAEVAAALQRFLNRYDLSVYSDACDYCVVLEYRTRAEARAATLSDPVPRVPFCVRPLWRPSVVPPVTDHSNPLPAAGPTDAGTGPKADPGTGT